MRTYTATEISRIHRTSKAIEGKIYKSETGAIFKGTKAGRLEQIPVEPSTTITTTTTTSTEDGGLDYTILLMGG